MQNVLVLVPAGTEPQQALQAAIKLARDKGGRLVVLVVIAPELSSQVTSTLTEVGFMGEQVGNQVGEAIQQEYRTQSEALLRNVEAQAKQAGVAVTPIIEQGDAGEICARVIRAHEIAIAVLVAEKRSWLTRFLSRSAAVKLPALAGCEVRVMEED